MKFNWITTLIIASALAILTLIAFQVRWIQHSQTLLEEQFNQRVNMALCNTVEKLAGEEKCSQVMQASCSPNKASSCCQQLDTLLESELFGHRKGAFTGAVENKPGRIQLANNGTLYLTEIGDLPLALQVKLLTFLDDKEVFPLGSIKGFSADARIIAATHRNLEQMVNDGRFRKDLLFRLNVIRLHLPPLRDRHGDVQLLLDHFLNTLSTQLGKKAPVLSRKA